MLSPFAATRMFSEDEAAHSLGITVDELHRILDQHVFTSGERPLDLRFTQSDVLMISCWVDGERVNNVIPMPSR